MSDEKSAGGRYRPDQARLLHAMVGRRLRFLNRLLDRMRQLRFPPEDPLYQHALRAQKAMQDLRTAAHYASCTSGVGKEAVKGESS